MSRTATSLIVVFILTGFGISHAQNWYVEEVPEWSAVFHRTSGWTGADGIFSIPLNGDETIGSHNYVNTLFVFSDTFIGEVDSAGNRLPGTQMVKNTLAWMPPGVPDPETAQFYYAEDDGSPATTFIPDTPNSEPDHWYWPSDGIALDSSVYFLAWRMRPDQQVGFARDGVAMLRLPATARPPFDHYQQWELDLFEPANETRGSISFGVGIMPNTERANAPFPDGYIYIYGVEEVPMNKRLLVARVPEEQFTDGNAWRFWAGQDGWISDFRNAVSTAGRVSPEMSVTPLPDGRYIVVYQLDTIGRDLAFKIGPTPWGPWGEYHIFYHCPEPDDYIGMPVWCYNAKAHPHLSEPGELLVSYNVSVHDFWAHFDHAEIYRPRFVRLIYLGNRF